MSGCVVYDVDDIFYVAGLFMRARECFVVGPFCCASQNLFRSAFSSLSRAQADDERMDLFLLCWWQHD